MDRDARGGVPPSSAHAPGAGVGAASPWCGRVLGELTSGLRVLSRYEEALAVGRKACDAADRVLARAFFASTVPMSTHT